MNRKMEQGGGEEKTRETEIRGRQEGGGARARETKDAEEREKWEGDGVRTEE